MNAVVFDLEVCDAGALTFAPFEIDQELSAVRVDRAELVQLGIVAVGDDAAVAQLRRRLGANARREERAPCRIDLQIGGDRAKGWRV